MIWLEGKVGTPSRVTEYTDKAAALKTAINARLWNADTGLYQHTDTRPSVFPLDANMNAIRLGVAPADTVAGILTYFKNGWQAHGSQISQPSPSMADPGGHTIEPLNNTWEMMARLHSDGTLLARIAEQFEGDYSLEFNLAAPLIARRDPATGQPAMKGLRGTRLDIFGYSAERRLERTLIADYERLVDEIIAGLDQDRHGVAVELASLPEQIRGYGHIKTAHLATAREREAALLAAFRATPAQRSAAE